ncbi:hypothetical protein GGR57DRAFT_361147 [Xylariaceae sp. FL1272]|nr:hypothetical protein GGR57DRAFT_361147 [Xylariaceae sp. FL1272]
MRLTNILHLNMAYLSIKLPQGYEGREDEWLKTWQESVEPIQNIISVVEHWDNQFTPRIDPAICFIVFSALSVLELHRRSVTNIIDPVLTSLTHGQNLLLLFLEQFASMWAMPRFLLQRFTQVQNRRLDAAPLSYMEIDRLISKLKTPLHPKAAEAFAAMAASGTIINGSIDLTMDLEDLWSFDLMNHPL